MDTKLKVMIAGIGGASLGTEILKSLVLSNNYEIYGCDVSPFAFGLYDSLFKKTVVVTSTDYVNSIIKAANNFGVKWIVPGGEKPMLLLAQNSKQLQDAGISLLSCEYTFIQKYSDKIETFKELESLKIPIPKTIVLNSDTSLEELQLPLIIKPATGTGGSALVFLATTYEQASIYSNYIEMLGGKPLIQEYIDDTEGEYTVGVISTPDRKIITSIALRRNFTAKLSVSFRSSDCVISSGYSQGYIASFKSICEQAEHIAQKICSTGAINIQGRVKQGIFLPFEINPRLSASTYLRAMAGCNEPDILLQYHACGNTPKLDPIREGWYFRTLSEKFVAPDEVKI